MNQQFIIYTTNKITMEIRQIKFRAWGKLTKDMHFLGPQENFSPDGQLLVSEHKILMQYTGLKDKNGKEIYELHELNNKWRVVYRFSSYILQSITDKTIFVSIINGANYEITREYCPLEEN